MRAWITLLLVATLLPGCKTTPSAAAPPVHEPAAGPFEDLAWLTGVWVTPGEGGGTEEFWTPPAGGTMLGVNRTIRDGKTVFFEYLRIELEGDTLVYKAQPLGRHPATPFRLVEASDEEVVFENPEHDYPQRILYTRDGPDGLIQQIEGEQGGLARFSEWKLRRRTPPAP